MAEKTEVEETKVDEVETVDFKLVVGGQNCVKNPHKAYRLMRILCY